MNIHTVHIHARPFDKISSGLKTIESRLNDEKRKAFKVGDQLTFISRENGDKIVTTIVKLHHFPFFEEMFSSLSPINFGSETLQELIKEIEQFYSPEEQSKYGVVGIEFKSK